jgi:hypothetical protein
MGFFQRTRITLGKDVLFSLTKKNADSMLDQQNEGSILSNIVIGLAEPFNEADKKRNRFFAAYRFVIGDRILTCRS